MGTEVEIYNLGPVRVENLSDLTLSLLTNFVPPYRISLFQALQKRVRDLRVLVSTPMEVNRPWSVNFGDMPVVVQRNMTLWRSWRHPHGFTERIPIHIPYDSLWQLMRTKPDVVITCELGARTVQALFYRWICRSTRLIIWATLSEISEEGRDSFRELARRWILPSADAVLVNGGSGRRYVRRFGVPSEKIFCVPQTTDVPTFLAIPLDRSPEKQRRLLYVGQLVSRKGLRAFLMLLRQWGERNPASVVDFWLLGDGPQRAELESQCMPGNVKLRFWGNVDYVSLPRFYADAGILAFPTLADEWGLVVNEAMAAGLPVLGSIHSQAVEELVNNGVTGWTFRPGDSEDMYRALDCALTVQDDQLRHMRTAARQHVESLTPEFGAEHILHAVSSVTTRQLG